jgi:hypothetical protein
LYDGSYNQLSVYNPGTRLNSVADTTLNPGMYYLKVEGKGNMYTSSYASLGSYTLHGSMEGGVALPVFNIRFNGKYKDGEFRFDWTIEADESVTEQVIEVAAAPGSFRPLALVPADQRNYLHQASPASHHQYRLKLLFADGHIYYSNIVSANSYEVVHKPKITGNPVNSGILYVNSPGNYSYMLVDLNGRIVQQGKIFTGINTVNIGSLIPGTYFVHYVSQHERWTDKILRQ